ncbi:class I SAM-dependent methyltransferase [Rhodococcus wratislaviensis]|uniref:class I SAM-dependent methyltransferase n=1 Tax=Rhodococcus wratislaviensis TaxID=44752 RepID=UPI003517BA69
MSQPPGEPSKDWPPPEDRDRVHWKIERGLREELLASTPDTRESVTRDVYNRLFEEVPWHKAHVTDAASEEAFEEGWFQQYGALTRPTDTVVDVGCGRGGLIRRFAPAVRECIGIDASDAMVELADQERPANARFMVGSVLDPPLPPSSADFVISRQVMEHLHPDDVPEHLAAVLKILRPGGRFLIETPSRLTGPWDISRGFTPVATGFHLREYTNGELGAMLRDAGFRRVRSRAVPSRMLLHLGRAKRHAYVPVAVKAIIERPLQAAPISVRTKLAGPLSVREVLLIAERK